jgi:hemin uptake protein HemP
MDCRSIEKQVRKTMISNPKESGDGPCRPDDGAAQAFPSRNVKMLRSGELFDGSSEIVIEHDGEHYRLRATRKGKLILTK